MASTKRSRGQVISRGPGKWLLRVYLGRDPGGKRRYTSRTVTGTRTYAEKEVTKMLRELDTETFVEPTKMYLRDFLPKWLEGKQNIAPRTRRDYRDMIDTRINPVLGGMRLHEISPARVSSLYASMIDRHLSPRTIQYTHSVLRQALQQAVRWNLLVKNPCEHVELPKKRKRAPTILTPKQVGRLLEATSGNPWYPLWLLLLTSGLRTGEASALQWSDLDEGWLSIQRAMVEDEDGHMVPGPLKTEQSARTIALPEVTLRSLEVHKRSQAAEIMAAGADYNRQGYIFANTVGNPWDRAKVRRQWKAALKGAGLPSNVRLYDTRHTHASHALAGGVDLKVISSRLGHSSIVMTADTYAHVMKESDREIAQAFDKLYSHREGTHGRSAQ